MSAFFEEILCPLTESIRMFSDRNAFYIGNVGYTYRQFSERISAIRRFVQSAETKETIWAIVIHDNLDTYAGIFALWMEGKAYIPLHPNQPLERNMGILEQVGLSYLLDSEIKSKFVGIKEGLMVIATGSLDYVGDFIDDWKETNDEDLAYILFTSGSTGIPKGVCLSRKNIATFMNSFWKTGICIDEMDRCLQAFDLTFDVSVQSFLVALTRGACVYTIPYGQVKFLYVASLIQQKGITIGAMAPSMLIYLRPYFDEMDASSLKTCILTAEACPIDLMEAWFDCAKNTEIYDFYGPTEATIYCTYYHLTRGEKNLSHNGIVSIGKPLANVKAIIIREDGSEVLGQEKGELCVSGNQVTSGYWKNQEKNGSAFFEKDSLRYYHTGDLCYWDQSGNIMYSGRIDQQAKMQGFRVELGEIEYHAREFFNKQKRVVAIAYQNNDNLTEIALFVESDPVDTKPLLDYLRSKMPVYMIPTRVLFEPLFPLNKSEKIDRNMLKLKIN